MKQLHGLILAASMAGWVVDQTPPPPNPPIRFPEFQPAPQPAPGPVGVPLLGADQLYVIDSDVDCLVLASPPGLVTVTTEPGPVRIRGKFVDGRGKVETKNFKGKWVTTIDAVAKGRVEILIVPVGATKTEDVIRKTLDVMVNVLPIPPPPDDPKKDPDPPPRAAKLTVVVVTDPATQTPEQGKVILSQGFRKVATGTGGSVELLDTKDPVFKANGYAAYATRVGGTPFVIVFDADTTHGVPLDFFRLPATEKDLEDRIGRLVKK